MHTYKTTVWVTRIDDPDAEPEVLVTNGFEQQAESFVDALPEIEVGLNQQWLKMRELASIVESDTEERENE